MKNLFALSILSVLALACNFSAGVKKDLMTGLYYSNSGLSVSEVYFVGPDNTPLKSNDVSVGTKVAIVLQGIENYEIKDGKAFPGLSLMVTDDQNKAVLSNEDLFAGGEGYTPEDASVLRGSVTVGDPMVAGKTYHVKLKAWDKNKTENTITAEIDLDVI